MKKTSRLMMTAGLSAAAVLMAGATAPHAARAQNAPAAPPASRAGRPLETILADISSATQITVVADSSVAQRPVLAPPDAATPATLETQLTGLTRRLGLGTQWVKLMLPQLPGTRTYKGDDVAEYALAQAKLFGNIGAQTAPGVIEILGQKVNADQATPVVSTLNLKPVYVLINPAAHTPGTVTPAANWGKMSPAEQKSYTDQQVAALKNMSPAQRTEMMQQQGAIMRSYFQSMSPEERQQMFQGMRGGMGGGGPMGSGGRRGGNNGGN